MVVTNFFFFLFFFLPFQFSVGSFDTSDFPIVRLIIPIIFLAWLLRGLYLRKIFLPRAATLFFLSAFLAIAALSVFWSENPLWATKKLIFWLNFFPLFFVLIDAFRNTNVREKALQGLIFGGTAVASVGILQFILQFFIPLDALLSFYLQSLRFFLGTNFANTVSEYPSILVNIGGSTFLRAFGFFPDPHIFAYYTSMIAPLALYRASMKNTSVFQKSTPVLLLLATLLSFSRASYVALLVISVVFAGILLWRNRTKVPALGILLFLTVFIVLLVSPVTARFTSSFSAHDSSVSERIRLSEEAVENISQAPFWGVGLGNYPLAVKPNASPREPIYVHNLYLDMAVEIGLVGLFFFLAFILSCLPKISFKRQGNFPYQLTLLASLGIFLIHSLFEYPLFSVHILPLLITFLALLYTEKYV